MRITAIILISAIFGTAIGSAVAVIEFRGAGEVQWPEAAEAIPAPPPVDRPAARVEILETEFDFGTMQRGTRRSHSFVVKNVGDAPLTLSVGATTCKCTLGVTSDEPVPPGGSTEVELDWTAMANEGRFRQTALLNTNDPWQSQVILTIVGEVTEAQGIEPADFVFDKISAGESKSVHVYVMAMFQDELEVSDPQLSSEGTRPFFDVKIEPVAREELPDPSARAGVRVTLTAKPELPLGSFNQKLTLRTNLPEAEELSIPVLGRVVGDIRIHGILWDDERSTLRLGKVKSSEGKSARLNIVVRGSSATETSFRVESTDPPELKVTLDPPKVLSETLVHVPLTVEVPAGAPPMVRLGTDQGAKGSIVLSTTHPQSRELVLSVRFTVER